MTWVKEPFFQVALPIIITFVVIAWFQNKRFDDLKVDVNRRFDDVNRRLDEVIATLRRIEDVLLNHERRITTLEERTSPLARR